MIKGLRTAKNVMFMQKFCKTVVMISVKYKSGLHKYVGKFILKMLCS